jgi:hypothetical protein
MYKIQGMMTVKWEFLFTGVCLVFPPLKANGFGGNLNENFFSTKNL